MHFFTVLAIIQLKAHQSINFHSILSNTNNNLLSRKEKTFFLTKFPLI